MNNEFLNLKEEWDTVEANSESSIKWVEKVSGKVKVIKKEADNTCYHLGKTAAKARLLSKVCGKKTGIGLFGESQVGKSYLVSTLASDKDGKLITYLGNNKEYNFIDDINPSGGGKESTGLVTRFTTDASECIDTRYPLLLQMLKENEIIKIIVNTYYNDFKNREPYDNSSANIADAVKKANCIQKKEKVNMALDEIFSLEDYIKDNFPQLENLGETYWKAARTKIIYGDLNQRADFFSVLWNGKKQHELTRLYKKLAKTLSELCNSEIVYAQEEALVPHDNNNNLSIINVNALYRLGSEESEYKTRVMTKDKVEVDIPLSELAALTAELSLCIRSPKLDIIKKMDLLDFPGYRGRMAVSSVNEQDSDNTQGQTLLSRLFLRGKVAYLFERYTDNLEINSLIVCTSADSQINTKMEDVIRRWIEKTQGETPEKRNSHQTGLLWAITKFDSRISSDLDKTRYEYGDKGLLWQAVKEKFGNEEWFMNWNGTDKNPQPFNNIFLVRKPGLQSCPFIKVYEGLEEELNSDFSQRIDDMKECFINDDDIKTYIADPEEAWDAVLKLNDGGMERICNYINAIDADKIRKFSIENTLKDCCNTAINLLDKWYTSKNNDEVKNRKKFNLKKTLTEYKSNPNMSIRWADILSLFDLREETIKDIYQHSDYLDDDEEPETEKKNNRSSEPDDLSDIDDLLNSLGDDTDAAEDNSHKILSFGEKIYNRWIDHMRNLSTEPANTRLISKSCLEFISSEIVNYAEKNNLKEKLCTETEEISKTKNNKDELWPVMVQIVKMIISDCIYSINNLALTDIPEVDAEKIPVLNEKEADNHGRAYSKKWMQNFGGYVKDNLGVTNPIGLDEQENDELGRYINTYKEISKDAY